MHVTKCDNVSQLPEVCFLKNGHVRKKKQRLQHTHAREATPSGRARELNHGGGSFFETSRGLR